MGALSIPNIRGVEYRIDGKVVTGVFEVEDDVIVTAVPKRGFKFAPKTDEEWIFSPTEDADDE